MFVISKVTPCEVDGHGLICETESPEGVRAETDHSISPGQRFISCDNKEIVS